MAALKVKFHKSFASQSVTQCLLVLPMVLFLTVTMFNCKPTVTIGTKVCHSADWFLITNFDFDYFDTFSVDCGTSGRVSIMGLKIIMFLGSVREGRNCTRVGNFIKQQIEARSHTVTVFDPLMMEFPLLKKPLHFHGPNEKPPASLVKYNEVIEKADGYVVVSGEYNRCIPPALTNMMDHFPPKSYRCKPCSIVCYSAGPGGGSTAGMQLRYFLGELGMVTPGFMYTIPVVHQAFSEDGIPDPSNETAMSKAARLLSELEWYATALKEHTEKNGLP